MIKHLGHKFTSVQYKINIRGLKYYKCNICDRHALFAKHENEWYSWDPPIMQLSTFEKLKLNCEEEQIKRLLE